MSYLTHFAFPDREAEEDCLWDLGMVSVYPFKIFSKHEFEKIDFEPITILYGGNGTGKSTALNIIAEKLNIKSDSIRNASQFYLAYVELCEAIITDEIPETSNMITSDDVFNYILDVRSLNKGIDLKREEKSKEYLDAKYSKIQVKSIEDYEQLKKVNHTRRKTQTKFIKSELMDSVRELSNGESAFKYFTEKINENGLYILDEPENSLSPKRQIELKKFIEDSVRYFGCQFIISTHSPFLLAMRDAKIYDLDESPVKIKKWTELENVRLYREFFMSSDDEFSS